MLDVLIAKPQDKSQENEGFRMSYSVDKPVKSFIKAVSWRLVGTLDTMMISYIVTGKMTLAFTIGSVEVITKTFLYYFHERIWSHIHRIRLKGLIKRNDGEIGTNKATQRA